MQDELMVAKVTLVVVYALHSNFAMDSFEIWNPMLIFCIKRGVGLCELKNKRNIFIVGKILTCSQL